MWFVDHRQSQLSKFADVLANGQRGQWNYRAGAFDFPDDLDEQPPDVSSLILPEKLDEG